MLSIGGLGWSVILPLGLLIREQPRDVVAGARAAAHEPELSTGAVLTTPQFWVIALTHFACCAAHSGPIFHMVTHAIDQGIAPLAAASVLGISGLVSIGGRIFTGVLADRFGAKRTLVVGLIAQ